MLMGTAWGVAALGGEAGVDSNWSMFFRGRPRDRFKLVGDSVTSELFTGLAVAEVGVSSNGSSTFSASSSLDVASSLEPFAAGDDFPFCFGSCVRTSGLSDFAAEL